MMNWFFTKVPKQFSEKRRVFSTIGVGKTGYQHAKTKNKTNGTVTLNPYLTLDTILTQSGSQT